MNFSAVFALEAHFRGLTDLKFIHQRIVLMRDLPQRLAFHRINFSWFVVVAGKQNGMPARHRQTGNDNRAIKQTGDRVVLHRDRINRHIIGYRGNQRITHKAQPTHTAIEILHSFDARRLRAAVGGHHHQVLHVVSAVFSFVAFSESEPLAVGRPFRA